jgi:hypothetical protein
MKAFLKSLDEKFDTQLSMDGLNLKLFSAIRSDVVTHFLVPTQKIRKYKKRYKKYSEEIQ